MHLKNESLSRKNSIESTRYSKAELIKLNPYSMKISITFFAINSNKITKEKWNKH